MASRRVTSGGRSGGSDMKRSLCPPASGCPGQKAEPCRILGRPHADWLTTLQRRASRAAILPEQMMLRYSALLLAPAFASRTADMPRAAAVNEHLMGRWDI